MYMEGCVECKLSHFCDENFRDKSRWIDVIKIFITSYDLCRPLMEGRPLKSASDESPDVRVVLKAIPASQKTHY